MFFAKPSKDFSQFYWGNGWAILRNVIASSVIDDFTSIYQNLLSNTDLQYKAMTTQCMQPLEINSYGYIVHPIADVAISDFINPHLRVFAEKARCILSAEALVAGLRQLHRQEEFYHAVMSMFFDANAGTPAHRDDYYLDSLPSGNLTACWVALEDINEEAGRFYVVSKSNLDNISLTDEQIRNADLYEQAVASYVSFNKARVSAPALLKGDVLYWNSKTVHGSLKTINPSLSRKSFTCHYIPRSCKYVRNVYQPIVRPCNGLEVGNVNFRFTSNVKSEDSSLNFSQLGRSLSAFENFT